MDIYARAWPATNVDSISHIAFFELSVRQMDIERILAESKRERASIYT